MYIKCTFSFRYGRLSSTLEDDISTAASELSDGEFFIDVRAKCCMRKGPATPPPRNEKRETRKLSSNQKSAARRFFLSERENLDDFQDRQPTDFLPPRKILTNQREVQ